MVRKGTTLVPTLYIFYAILHHGRQSNMNEAALSTSRRIFDRHIASFQRAMRAGVPIAMGSDCGNAVTEHGTNAFELELMVRYGMSPMNALLSATRDAARALRLSDSLGTLEAGKLADLLVVDGDPLAEIALLQDEARIRLVMKEGKPIDCTLKYEIVP